MNTTDHIFDLLDEWRHLPDYQLERRADIFFAAYLPEFLSSRLDGERAVLIPEFPIRLGTIYPETNSNQSCKIDYLAMSATGRRAIFLELKTDMNSRREKQNRYLEAAKEIGLRALLDGVRKIVCASTHKEKYCCLLRLLEKHALLSLPPGLGAANVNACACDIQITAVEPQISIFYLQPRADTGAENEIVYDEFVQWLDDRRDDATATRFAQSLRRWVVTAGTAPLNVPAM